MGPGNVSAEFEAAFHRGDGAAGYLREGTGLGDRDVWPGPWSVEKNHAFGANARLGYAPGGVLGEGGSVYFVTGVHWLRATVRRGSDIGTESIRNVADHTLRPCERSACRWDTPGRSDRHGDRSAPELQEGCPGRT